MSAERIQSRAGLGVLDLARGCHAFGFEPQERQRVVTKPRAKLCASGVGLLRVGLIAQVVIGIREDGAAEDAQLEHVTFRRKSGFVRFEWRSFGLTLGRRSSARRSIRWRGLLRRSIARRSVCARDRHRTRGACSLGKSAARDSKTEPPYEPTS